MTTTPPEPSTGQDEPPNTLPVLAVVVGLLDDVHDHMVRIDDDHELLLRLIAVRSVVRRLRQRLAQP